MRTCLLTPSTLLIALALPVGAWSQTTTEETATEQVIAPAQSDIIIKDDPADSAGVATKSTGAAGADTLSVDFPDEDIRNILRNVADLFELNLVIPDTLQGRTSIKLRDVTWRQIFQVVLSPVGFTYITEGNIIKIVSTESLQAEPPVTEVFIINYARAADIMPTLTSLVDSSKGGRIVVDARSNALVITERPSQMSRIRPIIETLDKATDQVMIESKFVEVTNSDIKNIGVNWASLSGMELTAGELSQTWTRGRSQERRNEGSSENTQSSQSENRNNSTNRNETTGNRTETNIDVPFMQNGYERADDVASRNNGSGGTNPSANTGIGAPFTETPVGSGNLSYSNLGPASSDVRNTSNESEIGASLENAASSAVNNLFGLANNGGTERIASAVFSASDFNVIISALKTKNDTKLVSNPTVVTLNNSEATINIGQEFPIPNYTYNSERGTYEVSGFEYKPLGIILKVTPQVNAQGFIKLTLEPEVSSSSESASFGGAQIPIVVTRKTKTQVSLKDGYTMGIGGLIENRVTNGQTRVPVLGSIPVLGRLFRSDSTNDTVRNLIIFITAKTVSADGAPIEEVFDPRAVRQMGLRRDELPGYRDGSDPFLPAIKVEEEKKK